MKCKLFIILVAVLSVAAFTFHGYDVYDDIQVAKNMTVRYANQSRQVMDGLKKLAGKDGKIKWSTSKVLNSNNADLVYSTAVVQCKDKTGKPHICVFYFRVNHDTHQTHLDSFFIDDCSKKLEQGLELIVNGELS